MGPTKDKLDFDREVEDGWAIFVPAGTWHNVTNIGDEPMQLYAVYAPVHHASGKVHATAADAEQDEESGTDQPPALVGSACPATLRPARLNIDSVQSFLGRQRPPAETEGGP